MSAGDRTNDSATRSTPSRSRELEIVDVLFGQRGHRHVHAGQRQPLVVGHRAALGDRTHHVVAVDRLDDQHHLAVVDQQAVPRRSIVSELPVGGGHAVVGALALLDGDPHGVTALPERMSGSEPAEPDLRVPGGRRARPLLGRSRRTRRERGRRLLLWSAWSPWLKFMRATSIPASTSDRTTSSELVAGPSVQTIFPRLFTNSEHSPAKSLHTTARGSVEGRTGAGRSDSPIR